MRIAVAIDGSDNALRAAKHAIMLAKHLSEAYLEILYVVDFNKAKDEFLTSQSQNGLALKRERIIHPVLELAKAASIEAKAIVLKGNPSQEIIKYANQTPIHQLVLGSRGLNTLQEMFLGSVSHKVMKQANCPVTIVK